MAATAEERVEALTRRVEALEKKLLASDGTLPAIPLTTAVRELERRLEALAGREKAGEDLKQVWEKAGRLERLVSPEYLQGLKTSEAAKAELLCSQVEHLRNFTDRIEEVLYLNFNISLHFSVIFPDPGEPAEGLHKLHRVSGSGDPREEAS